MRAVPGGHVALEGGLAAVDVCGVSVGEVKSLGGSAGGGGVGAVGWRPGDDVVRNKICCRVEGEAALKRSEAE